MSIPVLSFRSCSWYWDGYLCGLLDINISKYKSPDLARKERSDWRLGLQDGRKFRTENDKNEILRILRSYTIAGLIDIRRGVEEEASETTIGSNDGSELLRDHPQRNDGS